MYALLWNHEARFRSYGGAPHYSSLLLRGFAAIFLIAVCDSAVRTDEWRMGSAEFEVGLGEVCWVGDWDGMGSDEIGQVR
jgi:hypothetical protein